MPHHLFNPTNNNPSQSGSVGEKTYRPDEAIQPTSADLSSGLLRFARNDEMSPQAQMTAAWLADTLAQTLTGEES
jgi:hypothetical protein